MLRNAGTVIGTTGKLSEPKPFVKDSRTGSTEYPAVGVTPAEPAIRARQGAGVQALENELNALRARNDQAVAAQRPPSPFDGKVEPGFKPPPPKPLPAYTGPKIDVPVAKDATADTPTTAKALTAKKKSTLRKPNEKKSGAGSGQPET
ncbi:MAG: hypothetical protein LCH61_16820 [Proteobacteria bacterium]|nr:hypothetical protein [Pseudomonadota bacterium]